MEKFGYDYFDLILIHGPTGNDVETYYALEDALNDGRCRSIGLSNFNSRQFSEISTNCTVKLAINQIETHLIGYRKKCMNF